MTKAEEAVVRAAMHWWEQHRPMGWSLATHSRNATINTCTGAEHDLALACADYADKRKLPGAQKGILK